MMECEDFRGRLTFETSEVFFLLGSVYLFPHTACYSSNDLIGETGQARNVIALKPGIPALLILKEVQSKDVRAQISYRP